MQSQQQRATFIFNLDPLEAGCFPGTPVHAVQLHLAAADAPPVWFTVRLLDHLLLQRQHIQRMAIGKAAEAQKQHLEECLYSSFPAQLQADRFRKTLSAALEQFAQLRITVARPEVIGLPLMGT